MAETQTLSEMQAQLGQEVGTSRWYEMSAARIKAFADVTEDWQPIHIDEAAGATSPFGNTIAHGFLTLSLLSAMVYEMPALQGEAMGINYGFDRVRFLAPVPTGARVRGRFTLAELTPRSDGGYMLTYDVTVEIEGVTKPALAARWLGVRYLNEATH
ncbi:MaoC family dehydratase [Lentibacter sp. XHP0401]|uniref:MaoC family dehydratase n=1 Tax=Lentibacter sp. XHP0401 TaxID=2984334 RepID=UPI0029821BEA|nr:MaoC family dehydratase [Lentibacter sp. XHP0401]